MPNNSAPASFYNAQLLEHNGHFGQKNLIKSHQ